MKELGLEMNNDDSVHEFEMEKRWRMEKRHGKKCSRA